MARFGVPRQFADGERVMQTGKPTRGIYLVLSGAIRVTGRDAHGHEFAVIEHRAGAFSGEVSQLSGKPSFVDGVAVGEVDAIEIDGEQVHALLDRGSRARREDHAGDDPAPRGADRGRRRRSGAGRRSGFARCRAAAQLPEPQWHPAPAPRSGDRHRRAGVHRALRARAGAAAACRVPERGGPAQSDRERARPLHRHARGRSLRRSL